MTKIVTARAPKRTAVAPKLPKPAPVTVIVTSRSPKAIDKARRIAKIPHGVTR